MLFQRPKSASLPTSIGRLEDHAVLLVEDEPLILMDIQQALQEEGARVIPASTVQEARDMLAAERITAAILDYRLQDGAADDICRELTERQIPFVIYTGDPDVKDACKNFDIVSKPANPRLLVTRLLDLNRRA